MSCASTSARPVRAQTERAHMASTDTLDALPLKPRKRPLLRRKAFRRVLPWLVIVAIFLLWELVVRAFQIEQFVLPAPSDVFASGWEWRWPILDNSWQTLMTTVVGFA